MLCNSYPLTLIVFLQGVPVHMYNAQKKYNLTHDEAGSSEGASNCPALMQHVRTCKEACIT